MLGEFVSNFHDHGMQDSTEEKAYKKHKVLTDKLSVRTLYSLLCTVSHAVIMDAYAVASQYSSASLSLWALSLQQTRHTGSEPRYCVASLLLYCEPVSFMQNLIHNTKVGSTAQNASLFETLLNHSLSLLKYVFNQPTISNTASSFCSSKALGH